MEEFMRVLLLLFKHLVRILRCLISFLLCCITNDEHWPFFVLFFFFSYCVKKYADKKLIHTNKTMIRQRIYRHTDEQNLYVNLVYDQCRYVCVCACALHLNLFSTLKYVYKTKRTFVILYEQAKTLGIRFTFVYKSHVNGVILSVDHSLIYLNVARNAKERACTRVTDNVSKMYTYIHICIYLYIYTLWLFVPFRAQRSI